jgi:hypothetical protein
MVSKKEFVSDNTVWRLKITLLHLDPPIWRRFTVPDSITLARLHEVIQIVMGWTNSHLHAFDVGKQRYERINPRDNIGGFGRPSRDERKFTLASLGLRARSKFRYEYDFGDGWLHELVLEKILPADTAAFVCEDGEYACPPEDCGGPFGYPEVLAAAHDPQHPDHEHVSLWLAGFDPFAFSSARISRGLSRLAKKRTP